MTFESEMVEASNGDVAVIRVDTMDDAGIRIAVRFELFVGTRFVSSFGALADALTAFDAEIGKRPSPPRGPRM